MIMRSSLFFLLIHGAVAKPTGLVLVNTDTGHDIMELRQSMLIDTSVVGTALTIRAESASASECIEFDLDHGAMKRSQQTAPMVMAGKDESTGKLFSSATLQVLGKHTVKVSSCSDGIISESEPGSGIPAEPGKVATLHKPTDGIVSADIHTPVEVKGAPTAATVGDFASIVSGLKEKSAAKSEPVSSVPSTFHDRHLNEETDAITVTFHVSAGAADTGYGSATLPSSDVTGFESNIYGKVNGELKKHHKITLAFAGPPASATGNSMRGHYRPSSTFADYRVDVLFTHEKTGKNYFVPGYFAGDGNAANGQMRGNVWQCHLRPDEAGTWTWVAEFASGTNCAQNGGGDPASNFNGASGTFDVEESDKVGADLRAKGRLEYVGEHHLQFSETGEYFLKAGPESPVNFLAYEGFSGTPNNGSYGKMYKSHINDYQFGQSTWNNGNGKGIIGAINYLASQGVNMISATILTLGGDDKNVFPYVMSQVDDKLDFDIAKLAQWRVVFDHAESMGIAIHLKLHDGDSDDLLGTIALSEERKLLMREMVARFGDLLGIVWDLGEDVSNAGFADKQSAYIREVDPYESPIVVHAVDESVYASLLGVSTIDGASLDTSLASSDTLDLIAMSEAAGHKWIVSVDQQGNLGNGVLPDGPGNNHNEIRKAVLWANIMAGGAGVQYFFGNNHAESDLTLQDFRSRDKMWKQSKLALDFFSANAVRFWTMFNENSWAEGDNMVLADSDATTVVFYKSMAGTSSQMNIPGSSTYSVQWFNPRVGGPLSTGSVSTVVGGSSTSLGIAPSEATLDWVVLLKCTNC